MPFFSKWIHRFNTGYSLAFFLLLACYILTIVISNRLRIQTNNIANRDTMVVRMDNVLSNLKGAQAAWSQYILTSNNRSFRQYSESYKAVDSILNVVYRFSSLTPEQKMSMDTLNRLINNILPTSPQRVNLYSQNNFRMLDSLRHEYMKYAFLMDSITNLVNGLQSLEKDKVGNGKASLLSLNKFIKIISYITLFLTLFLVVYMLVMFNREHMAKRKAYQKADDYHKQLEARIEELTLKNKEIVRLKRLEKFSSLGRVAAMIAHEIKNPLTNINLATTQLSEEELNKESNVYTEIIRRNSQKINDLVNDFLNVTAFSQLNMRRISINIFLDEILNELHDRLTLEQIQIQRHYSNDICEVGIDFDKMKIAFRNILINAIEAMQPGSGILAITTQNRDNKCVVIIEDNGMGVDQETLSNIFDPYFTTKPRKGSGLGLAQTQNIILNHKGTIEVESKLHYGTRFIVTLDFAS